MLTKRNKVLQSDLGPSPTLCLSSLNRPGAQKFEKEEEEARGNKGRSERDKKKKGKSGEIEGAKTVSPTLPFACQDVHTAR